MSQDGEKQEPVDPVDPVENKEDPEVKDDPKADDAGEPNKDDETKPLMALPKIPSPFDEKPYVPSDQTDRDTYNLSACCCCLCACSHDRVGDASCFGCFPIRCGVIFIGMFIFFLSIILLIQTFFGLANEYLPWWFTFVTLLLEVPIAIAASIAVYFFAKDKRSTRGKLRGAAILSIVSVFLWAVW